MLTLTGSCQCGAVRYQIDAPLREITHCHCSICRKTHGAAFASYAEVPRDAFVFTQGEASVERFQSSPYHVRTFCRHCGSNLQFIELDGAEFAVAVGTLDTPLPPLPQAHIYVASKANWYEINDGLPCSMDEI